MKPLLAIDRESIKVMSSPQKREAFAVRLMNLLTDKKTTPAAKQFICQKLQTVGTSAEVPLLAKMLDDPATAEMARMTLEQIPGPQSLVVLRGSLDVLQGDHLAGAINSLAVRKDAEAVPKLKALIAGADVKIARAAFWALGNIADPKTTAFIVEKTETARDPLPLETAVPFLRAAEALMAAGHADRAMSIYDKLVEDLWDDLAATPSEVPVHDWQKEELERRKANLTSQPACGLSWEEVKKRIRSRHGR